MKRNILYSLAVILNVLTVPWLFVSDNIHTIGGFPLWALYSIVSTFIYAIIISYFLRNYWSFSASEEGLE